MMRYLLTLLSLAPALTACCLLPPDPTSMEAQLQAQLASQPRGEISFTSYSFNFLNRYRVSHDWAMMRNIDVCEYFTDYLLEFPVHDIRQVRIPPVQDNFKNRLIMERGKLLFGYDPNEQNPRRKWDPFSHVLPDKHFSKVTKDYILSFYPIGVARFPDNEIALSLINWPIDEIFRQNKRINEAHADSSFETFQVQRGDNTWTVNKSIYRNSWQNYQSILERWYLPIADTGYFYEFTIGYSKIETEYEAQVHDKIRTVFDLIIDSVRIEPLSEDEKLPEELIQPPPIQKPYPKTRPKPLLHQFFENLMGKGQKESEKD